MISKVEILNKLRELKPILNRDYSVKEIGLFGSFAMDSADMLIELEKLFKGNDQLKTNIVLQMRDAAIEFKTI